MWINLIPGEAPYGGKGGRVLQRTLTKGGSHETGVTNVSHHLQCGGGRSGPPLEISDCGRVWQGLQKRWLSGTSRYMEAQGARQQTTADRGRAEGKGRYFNRRLRNGSLYLPGVDPDRVWYYGGTLWPGGAEDECPKNRGDGLPYIPGGQDTGRQSL